MTAEEAEALQIAFEVTVPDGAVSGDALTIIPDAEDWKQAMATYRFSMTKEE